MATKTKPETTDTAPENGVSQAEIPAGAGETHTGEAKGGPIEMPTDGGTGQVEGTTEANAVVDASATANQAAGADAMMNAQWLDDTRRALMDALDPPAKPRLHYRVAALRPSFHCAQRHWTSTPEFVPADKLEPAQIAELRASRYIIIDGPMPLEKPR